MGVDLRVKIGAIDADAVRHSTYSALGYAPSLWAKLDAAGCPRGIVRTQVTYTGGSLVVTSAASLTAAGVPVTGSGTSGDPWVVDSVDLLLTTGVLDIRVGNLKFTRCAIHTAAFMTGDTAVVKCTSTGLAHAYDQLVLDQCDIYADVPSYWLDGVNGHGYTINRCNIFHVTDGVGPQVNGSAASGVKITNSWIHDLVFFATNPSHADGSHSDCIQPQGGSGGVITGNVLDGRIDMSVDANGATIWSRNSDADLTSAAGNGRSTYGTTNANAAIQFNNNQSGFPCDGWTVDGNVLLGGRYSTLNYGGNPAYGTYSGNSLTNNVFALPAGWTSGFWQAGDSATSNSPGYPISMTQDYTANIANGGNTMAADASPAPWRATNTTILRTG